MGMQSDRQGSEDALSSREAGGRNVVVSTEPLDLQSVEIGGQSNQDIVEPPSKSKNKKRLSWWKSAKTDSNEAEDEPEQTEKRPVATEDKGKPKFVRRFGRFATASKVLEGVDFSSKVAIVTGANSGIGFATSKALARHGCHVIMACRNQKRAESAKKKILRHHPSAQLTVMLCDLQNLESVREFADRFLRTEQRLDMLILNAGIGMGGMVYTVDGIESAFQTNYLSHFFMTCLLLDALVQSAPSRVVCLASDRHRHSKLTLGCLSEQTLFPDRKELFFGNIRAYADSKLCMIAFAACLDRRLKSAISLRCSETNRLITPARSILAFSVHPGDLVYSNFRKSTWWMRILFTACWPFSKSANRAAATSCFAASSGDLEDFGGSYLKDCQPVDPSPTALDESFQDELWKLSVDMIERRVGKGACQQSYWKGLRIVGPAVLSGAKQIPFVNIVD